MTTMANSKNQNTEAGGAATEQAARPRPCPQDCMRCSMSQQLFCATKMVFDLTQTVQGLAGRVAELSLAMAEVRERLQPEDADGRMSTPSV